MKQRLDLLLVDKGLAPSRSAAVGMIMAGEVSVDGRVLDKPGMSVDSLVELKVKQRSRYVSRGGDKLASVAEILGLDFNGKTILDVGSSTGGFTDYTLQHGAAKVYAVDVGTGQIDWRLRQDQRVVVMEQTDIRDVKLPEAVDIALIDVSFISLTKILDSVAALVKSGGQIVAMAKPQFEAGKAIADRFKGVITDEAVRTEVLAGLETAIAEKFIIENQADSAVSGAEGNRERFYLLKPRR